MAALKGIWEVRAGIIPGDEIEEHTRRFLYTSDLYEEDANRVEDAQEPSNFAKLQEKAMTHAQSLMNPSALNWVQVDWVWI